MGLTIDNVPADCLNGVDDCLEIAFTTDNLIEAAGSLEPVIISETDAGDFQIGTIIGINSAGFVLAAASDPSVNEVQYSGTPATMLSNLSTAVQQNYYINKNYTVAIVGTELRLTPRKAILQTDLVYENLSGGVDRKEVSFLANPVRVRSGYSAKVHLIDADTDEDLGEVRVYAIPKANNDYTGIESYRLGKDVAAIIKQSLSSPLPAYTTNVEPEIILVQGLVRNVEFVAAEAYGSPLNHYEEISLGSSFAVLNGGARKGDDLEEFCSSFVNMEVGPVNVTCNQPFWLYRHSPESSPALVYIQSVEFFSISGSSLGSKIIDIKNASLANMFAFEVGFPQLEASMGLLGISPKDVASWTVTIELSASGIPQDVDTITFDLVRPNDSSPLIFKTSLGTFSSIFVQAVNSVILNGAQEFIRLCTPCGASVDERGTNSVRVNDTFDISFNLYNIEMYDTRIVEELFASEEVYWVRDDKFYHLQPQNEDVLIFQKGVNINPIFNAKLYY